MTFHQRGIESTSLRDAGCSLPPKVTASTANNRTTSWKNSLVILLPITATLSTWSLLPTNGGLGSTSSARIVNSVLAQSRIGSHTPFDAWRRLRALRWPLSGASRLLPSCKSLVPAFLPETRLTGRKRRPGARQRPPQGCLRASQQYHLD